jgi:hypothetical protein
VLAIALRASLKAGDLFQTTLPSRRRVVCHASETVVGQARRSFSLLAVTVVMVSRLFKRASLQVPTGCADRVQRVHQISRGHASDGFADAVAVVDDGHSGFLDEVILKVVDVGDAAGTDRVPIRIVGVAGREAVVGVVVPLASRHRRER